MSVVPGAPRSALGRFAATSEERLAAVSTRLRASTREAARAAAAARGMTLTELLREAVEEHVARCSGEAGRSTPAPASGVSPGPGGGSAGGRGGRGRGARKLVPMPLWEEEQRELRALAMVRGMTLTELLRTLLGLGRTALVEAEGIPGSKADALAAEVRRLGRLLDALGPQVLAAVELGATAGSLASGGSATEDGLAAEARGAGRDQWEQLVDELSVGEGRLPR